MNKMKLPSKKTGDIPYFRMQYTFGMVFWSGQHDKADSYSLYTFLGNNQGKSLIGCNLVTLCNAMRVEFFLKKVSDMKVFWSMAEV